MQRVEVIYVPLSMLSGINACKLNSLEFNAMLLIQSPLAAAVCNFAKLWLNRNRLVS
jgi:hypothetical protein